METAKKKRAALIGFGTFGCKVVRALRAHDLQLWLKVDRYCLDGADSLPTENKKTTQWQMLPDLSRISTYLLKAHEDESVCNIPIPKLECAPFISFPAAISDELEELKDQLEFYLKGYGRVIIVAGLGGKTTASLAEWLLMQLWQLNLKGFFVASKAHYFEGRSRDLIARSIGNMISRWVGVWYVPESFEESLKKAQYKAFFSAIECLLNEKVDEFVDG